MTGSGIKHKSLNHLKPTTKVAWPDLQRIQNVWFWFTKFWLNNCQQKKNANKSIICIPQLQFPLHQLHHWGQVGRINFTTHFKAHTSAKRLHFGNNGIKVLVPFKICWKWHKGPKDLCSYCVTLRELLTAWLARLTYISLPLICRSKIPFPAELKKEPLLEFQLHQ